MKPAIRVFSIVVLTALVACGQVPPPEAAPASIKGTAITQPGDYAPLGAGLLMIDPDALESSSLNMALDPLAVPVEAAPGVYSTVLVPVDADGNFEIFLPEGDELPAGLTGPIAQFLFLPEGETCNVVGSVADARVSRMVLGLGPITYPGVYFMTLGSTAPSLTTTAPVDITDPDLALSDLVLVSWVYADKDVEITTTAGGCDVDGVTFIVDLALKGGWNQVEATYQMDSVTRLIIGTTLSDSAAEELYFHQLVLR